MTKFKAGDRVKIIDRDDSNYGCTVKIAEWDLNGTHYGYCVEGDLKESGHNVMKAAQIKLVEEKKEMTDFKVGDEVKVIDTCIGGLCGFEDGCIATVKEVGRSSVNSVTVYFNGTTGYTKPQNLELVHEVNVGDTLENEDRDYKREVLFVYRADGETHVVTKDTDDTSLNFDDLDYLKRQGWKLPTTEVEVTLEEIAEKFGIDKAALRIKE